MIQTIELGFGLADDGEITVGVQVDGTAFVYAKESEDESVYVEMTREQLGSLRELISEVLDRTETEKREDPTKKYVLYCAGWKEYVGAYTDKSPGFDFANNKGQASRFHLEEANRRKNLWNDRYLDARIVVEEVPS